MAKQRSTQERTSYIISSKESRKNAKFGKRKGKNKSPKKAKGKGK